MAAIFRNLILIFVFVIFFSCSSASDKKDAPPINRESFVAAMVDIHVLEAELTLGVANQNYDSLYKSIFKKNSITKENYEEALKYYAQHPVEMESVYDDVINELSKRQAKESN